MPFCPLSSSRVGLVVPFRTALPWSAWEIHYSVTDKNHRRGQHEQNAVRQPAYATSAKLKNTRACCDQAKNKNGREKDKHLNGHLVTTGPVGSRWILIAGDRPAKEGREQRRPEAETGTQDH